MLVPSLATGPHSDCNLRGGFFCVWENVTPCIFYRQRAHSRAHGRIVSFLRHDAFALKCTALRRFCGDGFLGSELKPAHLPPTHAKSA